MTILTELSDETAIRVLKAVASGEEMNDLAGTEDARQLAAAWRAEGKESVSLTGPVTDGQLARETLRWLATLPGRREAIETLAASPTPQRYNLGLDIGTIALIMLFMRATGVIEYKNKKWHFKLAIGELKTGPLGKVLDLVSKYLSPGE